MLFFSTTTLNHIHIRGECWGTAKFIILKLIILILTLYILLLSSPSWEDWFDTVVLLDAGPMSRITKPPWPRPALGVAVAWWVQWACIGEHSSEQLILVRYRQDCGCFAGVHLCWPSLGFGDVSPNHACLKYQPQDRGVGKGSAPPCSFHPPPGGLSVPDQGHTMSSLW